MEAPLGTEIEDGKIGQINGSINKEELLQIWSVAPVSITHSVGK